MKNIIVCGDLVWDTHIARLPSDPRGYFQPHFQSQLTHRNGGAWYLRDVIEQAIKSAKTEAKDMVELREEEFSNAKSGGASKKTLQDYQRRLDGARAQVAQFDAVVLAPESVAHGEIEKNIGKSGGVAKGFSVWEWFDSKEKPAKAKMTKTGGVEYKWSRGQACPGAWRIKEFLGCQAAKWPGDKGARVRNCPSLAAPGTKVDLVVIDDLGLGFVDHEPCWPAYVRDKTLPILIKATPPFDRKLWTELLKNPSKLNVVVAAAALRDAGARLSRGFSWDKTVYEIQKEFDSGGACWPLRHCERVIVAFGHSGAAVFTRTARSPMEKNSAPANLRFERFVFDPANLEETWSRDLSGITFGTTSVMTASIAVHLLSDPQPSSHASVSRGLAAGRELHQIGGGHDPAGFNLKAADAKTFCVARNAPPEKLFRSAFPRELLDRPVLVQERDLPAPEEENLLTDALGLTTAFLAIAAQDIVRFGRERVLESVPRLELGNYFTVDREEIERLNTVRNLILDYRRSTADVRPLSLAVFGPPGAGKSFAIKELCEALLGKDSAAMEFNLSQFADLDALHEAFHEVRDKSVQGQLPLVFWDEFDSKRDNEPLGWLKEFLAPMQDAKFMAKGKAHPFGKCIFIFAGGTCTTFKEFIKPIDPDAVSQRQGTRARSQRANLAEQEHHFKEVKGKDFVSRLRGYVNIKGPNPTSPKEDTVHIVRRALMLRFLIEKHHKGLIQPVTKELVISPSVLDAFLRVGNGEKDKGYLHGARSMESIVSLSRLGNCRHFGPSELPGREVLDIHASPDFMEKVEDKSRYFFTVEDIEELAAKTHELWMAGQKGYQHGPVRDDHAKPPTHPLMLDYSKLDERGKEGNRLPARLTSLRLDALNFHIHLSDHAVGKKVVNETALPLKKLAQSEHRRWMREKLLQGFAWAEITNDSLLLHRDICKFADLDSKESRLDHQIVQAMLDFIKRKGLVLVKGALPVLRK